MIILNNKALLFLEEEQEDNITYIRGYVLYYDGYRYELGRIKKDEGNFLYDTRYVYKWSMNKEYPDVYDVNSRVEVSKEESKQLIRNYRKKYLG